MQNVGNSFSLPFQSRDWLGTFAIQGLIFLIPIVGQMAMYGWALKQMDNYRQGRTDLVPAGFHLHRGVNIYLVWLVWSLPSLVIAAVVGLAFITAMLAGFTHLPQPNGNGVYVAATVQPGFYAAMAGLQGLFALSTVYGLALGLLFPAIWLATEQRGIAGGLNPRLVWSLASRNWGNTIVAALCIYAGLFLGGLGVIACCIGIIFTAPYGYAVTAAVLRYYEHSLESPPTPTAPTALAPS